MGMRSVTLVAFFVTTFYSICYSYPHVDNEYQFASPEHLFSQTRFHRTTNHHKAKRRHHVHASHQHHVKGSARQRLLENGFGNGFGNGNGNGFGNCMNPCGPDEAGYALGAGAQFNSVNQFEDGATGCCDSPRFTGRMRSTNNFHKVIIQSNQFHPNNPLHYTMPGRNYFEPTKHVYDNSPMRHVQSPYAPAFEERAASVVAPTQNIFNTVQRLCRPPVFMNPGCNTNTPVYPGDIMQPINQGPGTVNNEATTESQFSPVFGSTFMANTGMASLGAPNGNLAVQNGNLGVQNGNLGVQNGNLGVPNGNLGVAGGNGLSVGGRFGVTNYQMPEKCLPPVVCYQNNGMVGGGDFNGMFQPIEGKSDNRAELALPRNPFLRRYIPKLLGTIFQNPSRRHLKHSSHHHHHKSHHGKHVTHDD